MIVIPFNTLSPQQRFRQRLRQLRRLQASLAQTIQEVQAIQAATNSPGSLPLPFPGRIPHRVIIGEPVRIPLYPVTPLE